MMIPLAIGAGAGLASALLFLSLIGGTVLAFPLFFLAPMPLAIAALGWGTPAGLAAAGVGGLVTAAALSFPAGALFVGALGFPVVLGAHLIGLARPVDEADPNGPQIWFPLGEVAFRLAILVGAISLLVLLLTGFEREATTALFVEGLKDFVGQGQGGAAALSAEELEQLTTLAGVYVSAMPFFYPALWMLTIIFALWAGGRVVRRSERLTRPWQPMWSIAFPAKIGIAFVGTALVSSLADPLGLYVGPFAGTFFIVVVLVGLASLHSMLAKADFKVIALAAVYGSMALFGLPVLVVAALGLGELVLRFGAKAQARRGAGPSAGDRP
jgi:hypothetical protein